MRLATQRYMLMVRKCLAFSSKSSYCKSSYCLNQAYQQLLISLAQIQLAEDFSTAQWSGQIFCLWYWITIQLWHLVECCLIIPTKSYCSIVFHNGYYRCKSIRMYHRTDRAFTHQRIQFCLNPFFRAHGRGRAWQTIGRALRSRNIFAIKPFIVPNSSLNTSENSDNTCRPLFDPLVGCEKFHSSLIWVLGANQDPSSMDCRQIPLMLVVLTRGSHMWLPLMFPITMINCPAYVFSFAEAGCSWFRVRESTLHAKIYFCHNEHKLIFPYDH